MDRDRSPVRPNQPNPSEWSAVWAKIESHENALHVLQTQSEQAFSQILARLPPTAQPVQSDDLPVAPVTANQEPKLSLPQPFDGNPLRSRGFLTQCEFVFKLQPSRFASDQAKIGYVVTALTGQALDWFTAAFSTNSTIADNYVVFSGEFKKLHEAFR